MIHEYRAPHVEPARADNVRTESSPRVLDPSADFQSIRLTHQLQLVVVQFVSDASSKLVAIDEEAQHQIVHRRRFRKANRATDKPLDPRP